MAALSLLSSRRKPGPRDADAMATKVWAPAFAEVTEYFDCIDNGR
jgi:hypothetical protein